MSVIIAGSRDLAISTSELVCGMWYVVCGMCPLCTKTGKNLQHLLKNFNLLILVV
jgi:hypothetical protein